MMQELQASGKSLRAIAEALNAGGHTTRCGAEWNQVQVKRVLDRLEPESGRFKDDSLDRSAHSLLNVSCYFITFID